jgi:hypothetical protein
MPASNLTPDVLRTGEIIFAIAPYLIIGLLGAAFAAAFAAGWFTAGRIKK